MKKVAMKLGIIGCGKMGTALLNGILKANVFPKTELAVTDAISEVAIMVARQCGVSPVPDNKTLVADAEAIILCVKPGDALSVLQEQRDGLRGKLVISIVAGLKLASLERAAGPGVRVVRVMPNTPAQVHKGASAFALGVKGTAEDAELVEQIFGAVGITCKVKEDLLDAVTGLSGSGPAYVYVMIDALADAGVLMGLPRDLSLRFAAQTIAGSAEMVLQTNTHPARLKDMVTSPGGTTIAGLEVLEESGFRAALMKAVRAATERSQALGNKNT